MSNTLLSRLNFESGDSLVDGTTQIPTLELSTVEVEGSEILNEALALESASSQLANITVAAEELSDKGAESVVIANTLAPLVTAAVATVDQEYAEQLTEESVISLEADDVKGFWNNVKSKAIRIWEVLKETFIRFWEWLKRLVGKTSATTKMAEAALNKAEAKVKAVPKEKEGATVEIACSARWTIENKPVNLKAFAGDVENFRRKLSTGRVDMFAMVRKQYDYMNTRSEEFLAEIARMGVTNSARVTNEFIANSRHYENHSTKERNRIRSMLIFGGRHPLLGYFQNPRTLGFAPSVYEGADTIVFKGMKEVMEFCGSLRKLKAAAVANEQSYVRLQKAADGVIRNMEKIIKEVKVTDTGRKALENELRFQSKIMVNTMAVIREYVGSAAIQAVLNGAALVGIAAVKAKD